MVAELPEEAKHHIENTEDSFIKGAVRLFSLEADVNKPVKPTTTPLLARTTTLLTTTTHAPAVHTVTESEFIVEDKRTDFYVEPIDTNLDTNKEATKRRIVSLFSDRVKDPAILSTTTKPLLARITTPSPITTTYSSTTSMSEIFPETVSDSLHDEEIIVTKSDFKDREATKRRIVSLFSDRTRGAATASLFGSRENLNAQEESRNLDEELELMLDGMKMKVQPSEKPGISEVKIEEGREQEKYKINIGEGRRKVQLLEKPGISKVKIEEGREYDKHKIIIGEGRRIKKFRIDGEKESGLIIFLKKILSI